jgi:hypothetical protein
MERIVRKKIGLVIKIVKIIKIRIVNLQKISLKTERRVKRLNVQKVKLLRRIGWLNCDLGAE